MLSPKCCIALLCALSLELPSHGAEKVIQQPHYTARFSNGWLVEWKNNETGESFAFGEPKLPSTPDYRHYRPGFWSIDNNVPAEEEAKRGEATTFEAKAAGPDGVEMQQAVKGVSARLKALQWGIQIPYNKGLAVHWPRGLPPSRISGAGFYENLLGPDYFFQNRTAALVGTYKLRSNFYLVHGKSGGLLIYMDDSDLKNFEALEFLPIDFEKKVAGATFQQNAANGMIISNRSIQPPTTSPDYKGPRWIIQQYKGGINVGAQVYQDFVAKAYRLTPLAERPTKWVQDLAFVFVNSPNVMRGPKVFEGKREPAYNYFSEEAWVKGIEEDTAYLRRLSQVVEPDKVLFYTTEWTSGGHDTDFPEFNPDPYVAEMSRRARAMGFHVMLHLHNSMLQSPTPFADRYLYQPARNMGLDPEKDLLPGVYFDELRNQPIVLKNKEYGTVWNDRLGQRRYFTGYHMNPAAGGWRRLFVNRIITAMLATHADALHLDVPDWMVERYNDRYGMNPIEGQAELYRLLRQSLDENGMKDVAISCEITPNEAFMRYVDMGQRSRNTSARSRMKALEEGSALSGEDLITLQTGAGLDDILKARKKGASEKKAPFDPQKALKLLHDTGRDLGVPSVDNLAFSHYVQAYPHLGASLPEGRVGALAVWYWMVNDAIPTGVGGDLTKPVSPFYYGILALGRFRSQEHMRLETPGKWVAGDLATYQLFDGRRLRVYRVDDTTLRFQLENGPVLAEMDLFSGWKNAEKLFSEYGPKSVEIQK